MIKIAMLGAGSQFTVNLARDIMLIPGIGGGEFVLVDIDPERLRLAGAMIRTMAGTLGGDWRATEAVDRREVLAGSDFLVNSIEVSGAEATRLEYEIPKRHGVDLNIGDTLNAGGLFKAFRNIPTWLEVLRDAEELCPGALVLNYSNPMSSMTLAASRASRMRVLGLCHSVQNTAAQLAGYLEVPPAELEWACAGINHMAWFTRLRHGGQDAYPRLLRRAEDPDVYARDRVRFDALKHLGCFVSESSAHFAEYVPYYRKRPELLTRFGLRSGRSQAWWDEYRGREEKFRRQVSGEEPIDMKRSNEYASVIIEALVLDRPATVFASVPNRGLVENLPADGIVEVACAVDGGGVRPRGFGKLPVHLAALCASNMAFFDLAVTAALNHDRQATYHALMLDPLTAAVCAPDEIVRMADELFAAEAAFLQGWA
jgi:alpha-galactosidase